MNRLAVTIFAVSPINLMMDATRWDGTVALANGHRPRRPLSSELARTAVEQYVAMGR